MKTIISDEKQIYDQIANEIQIILQEKKNAVLAFSSGESVKGLFTKLLGLYQAGKISFRDVRVFAVTEFVDVAYEFSSRKQIYEDFLSHTDFCEEHLYLPEAEKAEALDDFISRIGGIDLAVLGLGANGHIGYNEPASPYASRTRIQKLTEPSRRQLLRRFGEASLVPAAAITMGIKTLCDASRIILLALGKEKSEAVYKMLYGRNDSVVPAAFLQIPMNVTVYLDKAASSLL